MPTIPEIRRMYPGTAGLTDFDIVNDYARANGLPFNEVAYDFGYPIPDTPSGWGTFKGAAAQGVAGVGRLMREDNIAPVMGREIELWGRDIAQRNAGDVNTFGEFLERPGAGAAQFVGQGMGTTVLPLAAQAGGAALMAVPFLPVKALGAGVSGLGSLMMYGAGYESDRQKQERAIAEGAPVRGDEVASAHLSALINTLIESKFGFQHIVRELMARGISKEVGERAVLAEFSKTPWKTARVQAGKTIGAESLIEEPSQAIVSNLIATREDPFTEKNLKDMAFSSFQAAIGSAPLGGAYGAYKGLQHAGRRSQLAPFIDADKPYDLLNAYENRDFQTYLQSLDPYERVQQENLVRPITPAPLTVPPGAGEERDLGVGPRSAVGGSWGGVPGMSGLMGQGGGVGVGAQLPIDQQVRTQPDLAAAREAREMEMLAHAAEQHRIAEQYGLTGTTGRPLQPGGGGFLTPGLQQVETGPEARQAIEQRAREQYEMEQLALAAEQLRAQQAAAAVVPPTRAPGTPPTPGQWYAAAGAPSAPTRTPPTQAPGIVYSTPRPMGLGTGLGAQAPMRREGFGGAQTTAQEHQYGQGGSSEALHTGRKGGLQVSGPQAGVQQGPAQTAQTVRTEGGESVQQEGTVAKNAFGLPMGSRPGPAEKVMAGQLRADDWISEGTNFFRVHSVTPNSDGTVTLNVQGLLSRQDVTVPSTAVVTRRQIVPADQSKGTVAEPKTPGAIAAEGRARDLRLRSEIRRIRAAREKAGSGDISPLEQALGVVTNPLPDFTGDEAVAAAEWAAANDRQDILDALEEGAEPQARKAEADAKQGTTLPAGERADKANANLKVRAETARKNANRIVELATKGRQKSERKVVPITRGKGKEAPAPTPTPTSTTEEPAPPATTATATEREIDANWEQKPGEQAVKSSRLDAAVAAAIGETSGALRLPQSIIRGLAHFYLGKGRKVTVRASKEDDPTNVGKVIELDEKDRIRVNRIGDLIREIQGLYEAYLSMGGAVLPSTQKKDYRTGEELVGKAQQETAAGKRGLLTRLVRRSTDDPDKPNVGKRVLDVLTGQPGVTRGFHRGRPNTLPDAIAAMKDRFEQLERMIGGKTVDAIVAKAKSIHNLKLTQDLEKHEREQTADIHFSAPWGHYKDGAFDTGQLSFVRNRVTRADKETMERVEGQTWVHPLVQAAEEGYSPFERGTKHTGLLGLLGRYMTGGTTMERALATKLHAALSRNPSKQPKLVFGTQAELRAKAAEIGKPIREGRLVHSFYDKATNTIYLPHPEVVADPKSVNKKTGEVKLTMAGATPANVLHEALHGTLQWFVEKFPHHPSVRRLAKIADNLLSGNYGDNRFGEISDVLDEIGAATGGKEIPGAKAKTDQVLELMSYGLTHNGFTDVIGEINDLETPPPQAQSLIGHLTAFWDSMMNVLHALLGGKPGQRGSIATDIAARTVELLSEVTNYEGGVTEGETDVAPATPPVPATPAAPAAGAAPVAPAAPAAPVTPPTPTREETLWQQLTTSNNPAAVVARMSDEEARVALNRLRGPDGGGINPSVRAALEARVTPDIAAASAAAAAEAASAAPPAPTPAAPTPAAETPAPTPPPPPAPVARDERWNHLAAGDEVTYGGNKYTVDALDRPGYVLLKRGEDPGTIRVQAHGVERVLGKKREAGTAPGTAVINSAINKLSPEEKAVLKDAGLSGKEGRKRLHQHIGDVLKQTTNKLQNAAINRISRGYGALRPQIKAILQKLVAALVGLVVAINTTLITPAPQVQAASVLREAPAATQQAAAPILGQYDTRLSPREEARFARAFPDPQATADYDMRGAFRAGVRSDRSGHYPDTFKKPNHITFSTDSKYHGKDGNVGGKWTKKSDGTWRFTPGATNLQHHTPAELRDYFNRFEPGNELVLPATMPAPTPAPAAQPTADFGDVEPGADVQELADTILRNNDHGGKSFIVVSKRDATMYVFNEEGRLLGHTPTLLGKDPGDLLITRTLAQTRRGEAMTASGRFDTMYEADADYGSTVTLQGGYGLAVHRVYLGTPSENRLGRLNSKTISDNRISYGCLNIPELFYQQVMSRAFGTDPKGVIYIMPETEGAPAVETAMSAPVKAPGLPAQQRRGGAGRAASTRREGEEEEPEEPGPEIDMETERLALGQAEPLNPRTARTKVSKEVEKILRGDGFPNENGAMALREALAIISRRGPPQLRQIAKDVLALMPTTGIRLQVDDRTKGDNHGVVTLGTPDEPVAMRLFTANGKEGLAYETVLHEAWHAAIAARYGTLSFITDPQWRGRAYARTPEANKALQKFHDLWREYLDLTSKMNLKGTDNSVFEAALSMDEFFVRALTDPALQKFLADHEYRGQTFLQRFKNWVKHDLMGYPHGTVPSWLDAALVATREVRSAMLADPADYDAMHAKYRADQRMQSLASAAPTPTPTPTITQNTPAPALHAQAQANGGAVNQRNMDYTAFAPTKPWLENIFKMMLPQFYGTDPTAMRAIEAQARSFSEWIGKHSPKLAAGLGLVYAPFNTGPVSEKYMESFKKGRRGPVTIVNEWANWARSATPQEMMEAFDYMDNPDEPSLLRDDPEKRYIRQLAGDAAKALKMLNSRASPEVQAVYKDLPPSEQLSLATSSSTVLSSGFNIQEEKLTGTTEFMPAVENSLIERSPDPATKGKRYYPRIKIVNGDRVIDGMVHEDLLKGATDPDIDTSRPYVETKARDAVRSRAAGEPVIKFRALTTARSILAPHIVRGGRALTPAEADAAQEAQEEVANAFVNTVSLMANAVATRKLANDMVMWGSRERKRADGTTEINPDPKVFATDEELLAHLNRKRKPGTPERTTPVKITDVGDTEAKSHTVTGAMRLPGNWVRVPESNGYGELSGKIIEGPLWSRIMDSMNTDPIISWQFYNGALRMFKKAKTVYNLPTVATNVMTNFTLAFMNNLSYQAVKQGLWLYVKYKNFPQKLSDDELQLMSEFHASGATLGDFSITEIKQMMYEAMAEETEMTGVGFINELAAWMKYEDRMKRSVDKMIKAGKWTDSKAVAIYAATDNMFRFAAFISKMGELQRTAVRDNIAITDAVHADMVDQAGTFAKKAFLDYDIDSQAVKFLRQTALPFVSWPYAFAGVLFSIAKNQPWKIATLMAAYTLISTTLSAAMGGGDDEDDKRRAREHLDERTWFGAYKQTYLGEWGGKHLYFDTAKWFMPTPLEFKELPNGFLGWHSAPSALTPSNPVLTMLILAYGLDPYTGKPLSKDTDEDFDRFLKGASKMLNQMLPPMLTPRSGEKLPGGKILFGAKPGLLNSEVNETAHYLRTFVFPMTAVDEAESRKGHELEIQSIERGFDTLISNTKRDATLGKIPYDELMETMTKLRERKAERLRELREHL